MPFANSAVATGATAPSSAIADGRNLTSRVLSGVVLAPLVVAIVLWGKPFFEIAAAAAAAIGFREWVRLVTGKAFLWTYALPPVLIAAYWAAGIAAAFIALAVLTGVLLLVSPAEGARRVELAFGLPYVGVTLLSLSWLRDSTGAGWPLVLFVFLIVWATDIGAFFVGRAVGGPRLAPSISPNKTWAGFAGGLVLAALAALVWGAAATAPLPLQYAVPVAAVLSLIGQGGDLFESAAKRRFGAKDSGSLIPGHGGLLDRVDALLAVAPVAALMYAFGLTTGGAS